MKTSKTGHIPISRCPVDMWAGVCCCHEPPCVGMCGFILTCSNNVFTDDFGNARIYDLTIGLCSHTGVIVSGSKNTFTNDRHQARVSDIVVGCNVGVVVTGVRDSIVD